MFTFLYLTFKERQESHLKITKREKIVPSRDEMLRYWIIIIKQSKCTRIWKKNKRKNEEEKGGENTAQSMLEFLLLGLQGCTLIHFIPAYPKYQVIL